MNIIWAILIFSFIVIIHEFGHYFFAKLGGIKVIEFSLGMGPRLFSFHAAGTRWSVKLLPLGGSCMMEGEDSASEDEGSFSKKPVLTRILTVFGGPLFNFILAYLLSVLAVSAVGLDRPIITGIIDGEPAYEAGLRKGDVITRFNGKKIALGRELMTYLHVNRLTEKPVEVEYKRDGKTEKTEIVPAHKNIYQLGFTYMQGNNEAKIETLSEDGPLKEAGVKPGDTIVSVSGTKVASGAFLAEYLNRNPLTEKAVDLQLIREGGKETYEVSVRPKFVQASYSLGLEYNMRRQKEGMGNIFVAAFTETKSWIASTIDGLKYLVTGRVGMKDLAGPVGIANMIGNSYEASKSLGLHAILLNMAIISIMISANLGIVNLFPIPALDGGRLIFLFIEAIRGKALPAEKEGVVHFVGFVMLMGLMVFVLWNDIMRFIIR